MPPRHSLVAFVILAAGLGSRLNAVIGDKPKWLVPVRDDLTVAEHQLRTLEDAISPEAPHLVVTGAHHAAIDQLASTWSASGNTAFTPHFNPHFGTWNNWFSVLTGLDRLEEMGWDGHTIVLNGDVFCPPEWINSFAAELPDFDAPIALAVDPHHELTDEAMKVSVSNGRIAKIGKVDIQNPYAEYIGLTGLSFEGSKLLREQLHAIGDAGRFNDWYEGGIQEAINAGVVVSAWETPPGDWVEIDNEDDLDKARSIAAAGDL